MSPLAMTLVLVVAWGLFAWSVRARWRLMRVGVGEMRWDRVGQRIAAVLYFGLGQKRMRRYLLAGLAHMAIFFGFLVLLLRSLMLFGRGYAGEFSLWILGEDVWLGKAYALVKDIFVLLVIVGVVVFFYCRLIARLKRMTLKFEGLLILLIILVMMLAELLYDGSHTVLTARGELHDVAFRWYVPGGSAVALIVAGASSGTLNVLQHVGFWTHVSLVLIFLNLLPYTKHFHVITALPNVFLQQLSPVGRLRPIEDIEGRIEREQPLGVASIQDLTWKHILDLYTCTECGRCSDHCPATNTGKLLSPKHLTIDLRDHLYVRNKELVAGGEDGPPRVDLTPEVIKPEVLWACTTCRACEQECPVFISYVDKIVAMRQQLVMEKSEFPNQLQVAFRGLETNMNPWSFPAGERDKWAGGLDVPRMSDKRRAEYLFWVGCGPSFDDRARKTTRAFAQLLIAAGVDFAILGKEEQCNGDPARRAGNEFLFQMLAQANVEVLGQYEFNKIVTTCPHCFNVLKNEYPDFGGEYDVIHHTELLAELIRQKRISPTRPVNQRIVFHDSCYLGRYNQVYDPPREVLRAIPGLELVEAAESRDRGMCCGAGGAQMFKEEEKGDQRVNHRRADQLLATGSQTLCSACPFCMTMLTDGLKDKDREDIGQLDVAELLWQSVSETPLPSGERVG